MWRRDQSLWNSTRLPSAAVPVSDFGTTMYAQRVPVNPAVFEKLRNSIAHSRAPSIS